jgi:hypothetical protein
MDVGSAEQVDVRFGPHPGLTLSCADPAVLAWALEFFGPSLQPGGPGPVRLEVGAEERHEDLVEREAEAQEERPWFAFDQSMYSLPTLDTEQALLGIDSLRGCAIDLRPSDIRLVGDPRRRRWRLDVVLVIHEIVATALRRDGALEVHAASIEAGGRAVLLVGPKGAGKTTLSFHLLRSGLVRWLANDRVFAAAADGVDVLGVPTALKVRPATAAEFPDLGCGLPEIERPYLYGADEETPMAEAEPRQGDVLMLSPSQVAARLGAKRIGAAPLGALLFPEVDTSARGWSVQPISTAEAEAAIWRNLFGDAGRRARSATVFEELSGGRVEPDPAVARAMAEVAPAFAVTLGRGAYEDANFAERFLAAIGAAG